MYIFLIVLIIGPETVPMFEHIDQFHHKMILFSVSS